jgi:hypothetical protein
VTGYPTIRVYRRNPHNYETYQCKLMHHELIVFVNSLTNDPRTGDPLPEQGPLTRRATLESEERPVYEAAGCLEPAEPAVVVS